MGELTFILPTLNQIYNYLIDIATEIKNRDLKIDTIVGISRGGLIPARFLSDLLLIPDIKIVAAGFYSGPNVRMEKPIIYTSIPEEELKGKNILLVDDVADTGETLEAVRLHLLEKGAKNVYTAVIYVKPWNKAKIDFYSQKTDAWIIFPWEFIETAQQLFKIESWNKFKREVESNKDLVEILNRFLGYKE